MTEIAIVQADPRHISQIVADMRELDYQEIQAASDIEPTEALDQALQVPDTMAWTMLAEGVPVVMGGLAPSPSTPGWAIVWLVGTNWITSHAKTFTVVMQEKLDGTLEIYNGLYNWVDARNEPAKAWLEAMGFKVEKAEPFGARDMDFHYFWITSPLKEAS